MPRKCRGCSICATSCPAAAKLSEAIAGFQRGAACRAGGRDRFPRSAADAIGAADGPRGRAVRRHLQPLFRARESRCRASRCSPPPATACMSRGPRTARAPAVLRPHVPRRSARSMRRGARPSACSRRLRRIVARGVPVIGLEPSCMLSFRDEIPALIKSDEAQRARRATRCCSRNFWRAKPRRGGSTCRSSRSQAARCCTAIAIRKRSA